MRITAKKIVMIILLAIGLIVGLTVVIFPTWFGLGAAQDPSTVPFPPAYVLYIAPTYLLSWVGIYAGYNFAMRREYRLVGILICCMIGTLISTLIAIYEIFKKD